MYTAGVGAGADARHRPARVPLVVWYGLSIPGGRTGYNQQKIPFDKNFIKGEGLYRF